jgi:hypothetical protein
MAGFGGVQPSFLLAKSGVAHFHFQRATLRVEFDPVVGFHSG